MVWAYTARKGCRTLGTRAWHRTFLNGKVLNMSFRFIPVVKSQMLPRLQADEYNRNSSSFTLATETLDQDSLSPTGL
jgi:hypothetical protein